MEPKDKGQLIDEWLDRALTQYGQSEPRPGLENRVLAAVRAERERGTARKWHWWPALAALAAMLLIGAGMHLVQWKRGGQAPLAEGNQAPIEQRAAQSSPRKTASVEEAANRRIHAGVSRIPSQRVVESAPVRLEQFPSPEPLSEQEKILARYVQQFPREADLTAQAQAELSREEMMAERTPESDFLPSSELQNQ